MNPFVRGIFAFRLCTSVAAWMRSQASGTQWLPFLCMRTGLREGELRTGDTVFVDRTPGCYLLPMVLSAMALSVAGLAVYMTWEATGAFDACVLVVAIPAILYSAWVCVRAFGVYRVVTFKEEIEISFRVVGLRFTKVYAPDECTFLVVPVSILGKPSSMLGDVVFLVTPDQAVPFRFVSSENVNEIAEVASADPRVEVKEATFLLSTSVVAVV